MTGDGATVGGVVLAAGESNRFGSENKLLAQVAGGRIVRQAALPLVESGLPEVVAVLGHEADRVADTLEGIRLDVLVNHRYDEGQHTSVAVGVDAARERGWDAAVFALGDMPFVDSATVDRLLEAYRAGEGEVLAPTAGDRRGNPVLFDAAYFDELAGVDGDRGGRGIVEAEGTLVPVEDPGVHRDVDTRGDLPGLDDPD